MNIDLPRMMKHVVTGLTAALMVLPGPNPAQAPSEQVSTNSKLNSDFLHAVEKGDVKKIRALASQGIDLNLPSPVVDINDLEVTANGYRYKFKPDAPIGGSRAMLTAIESARPESVRTLIDLGADVKTEFFIDADLGPVPVDPEVVAAAIRNGSNVTVVGAFKTVGDHVVSSIRPTPATKMTYLGFAEKLLSTSKDAKRQRKLQEIVNMLRQAAVQEVPTGVSKAGSQPGDLAREEPAPYAAMLSFQAGLECRAGGAVASKCTNMFVFGNYVLQTSPPSRQVVGIRVAGAPASATWALSNAEVAVLSKTDLNEARLQFLKDGDTELSVQNAGQLLLRVHLQARKFEGLWQVEAFRVTEKGEMIDGDGRIVKKQ